MKILVTAGPTCEDIDPVRFISNRSSGKMGYALAHRARARGHAVSLVTGPTALPVPRDIACTHVRSAEEMNTAVLKSIEWCDVLIMAAAVADWRPKTAAANKLKKTEMSSQLALERTPDVLMNAQPFKGKRIYVGFAAETDDLLTSASDKLRRKGLDLIVANDISRPDAGFNADTNQVVLLSIDGEKTSLPLMPKPDVADKIIDWIETRQRNP